MGIYFTGASGFGEQIVGFFFRDVIYKYLVPFFFILSPVLKLSSSGERETPLRFFFFFFSPVIKVSLCASLSSD